MLDEYFKPPPNVDHPVPEVPTLIPAASTSSPSSTTVDQDAPSTSTSQTTSEQQSSVIPQGVEDDFYDIEVAHMDNDTYFYQNRRDLPRDNPLVSVEVLRYDIKRSKSENKGIVPTEMELVLEQTQQGTSHEVSDYIEMEMQIPRSSKVKFIATCSYSRLNDFITSRKNDPKLPQTLISTSSLVCQSDEVMN
ncbi:hypothetical protein Tco_1392333 [Tanacetum coccineum]